MTQPVLITFDADAFRAVTDAAGDMTLEQIAQRTGVDTAVLSRLFTGKRQPAFPTAVRCAAAYGVLIEKFARWESAPADPAAQNENAA